MSCAAFTILGLIEVYATNANVWAIRGTFTLAVGFIFVGFFQLWNDQHRQLLVAQRDLSKERENPRITSNDWQKISAEADKCRYFRVDHHWNSHHEHYWTVTGCPKAEICEMLLRRAGNMLLRSPTVSRSLTDVVRMEEDSLIRWMRYMDEHQALVAGFSGIGYERLEGGEMLHHYSTTTKDLMYDFVRLCDKCAALEI